jgi:hypothetical protein
LWEHIHSPHVVVIDNTDDADRQFVAFRDRGDFSDICESGILYAQI